MRFLQPVLLAISILICANPTTAQGSESPSAALAQYPECARPCIVAALGGGWCAPTDVECRCTNEEMQRNITSCVTGSCQVSDALATKNTSMTACGAPVRDRSHSHIVLPAVLVSVCIVFVAIRLVYRVTIAQMGFGWDDWFILAAMLVTLPCGAIIIWRTVPHGLGRDIWTLEPEEITKCIFYFWIMACLYFVEVTLVKLSILSFFLRIFPGPNSRRVIWGTLIFTAVWGIAFFVTALAQCQPTHYFWTKWDGLHEGRCANANAISWSNAIINIILDIWMLAIPLWHLKRLRMHWKKKLSVAIMFCVGTFVTVISILRLQSLIHFATTTNSTWEFYDISFWSVIEIAVGIMCACLPAIRTVLVNLFPTLLGSTAQSQSKSNQLRNGGSNVNATTHKGAISSTIHHMTGHNDSEGPFIMLQDTESVKDDYQSKPR